MTSQVNSQEICYYYINHGNNENTYTPNKNNNNS